MKNSKDHFSKLVGIIARLRGPDGCPWDQKQDNLSMRPYLLEETHELSEAMAGENPDDVKEELGDLFFQLILISQIYQDKGYFKINDVIKGIIDKMVRRHPHVFAGQKFDSPEELRRNWARIKAEEKSEEDKDPFDLPRSLPALNRGQRVIQRANRAGHLPGKQDESTNTSPLPEKTSLDNRQQLEQDLGRQFLDLIEQAGKHDLYCEEIVHKAIDNLINQIKK